MTSLRIGIIGAGPGGICMGVSLRQAGFERFTILEQAEQVGGVWHHNTYPGAACDIPSHLYSFSFAPKLDWTKPYASQVEIRAYLDRCVDDFGLRPHLRLGTGIVGANWMDDRASWRLTTDGGDTIDVEILISALGMFNRPYYPSIAGLDGFGGTIMHTARWDHGRELSGERVAVIGSGASAIQLVPEIAPVASQLHVYQRTPNWVLPKQDTPFTEDELEEFRRRPAKVRLRRHQQWNTVNASITYSNDQALRAAEEFGRANIAAVNDEGVRARLTPDHPFGCKRPLVSNSWYPTFNLPQVELITDGVARISPTAVVTTTGQERAVDTIVLATGFRTSEFLSAIPVVGRREHQLSDAWRDGAHAYLGITMTGFPNLFMLYGPTPTTGPSST
jgi:cation diffusion facilitator CzcD-associated flavoprotein CzcO